MLTVDQEDQVRRIAVELFGEETVKKLDKLFLEYHDLRLTCKDNYEFLMKVKQSNNEHGDELVAALLYGMKLGELGLMYYLKQREEEQLPKYGYAS